MIYKSIVPDFSPKKFPQPFHDFPYFYQSKYD